MVPSICVTCRTLSFRVEGDVTEVILENEQGHKLLEGNVSEGYIFCPNCIAVKNCVDVPEIGELMDDFLVFQFRSSSKPGHPIRCKLLKHPVR